MSSMCTEVVVHIGMPKTGSSAIQRFCLNNRKALSRAGFYYPKHAMDANGISGGHSLLASRLRSKEHQKAARTFKWMLLKARLLGKTLLLSSEGYARAASSFAPLLEGRDVKVVGWLRHPVEYFVSSYNQSVKRGFVSNTLSGQLPCYLKRGGVNQGAKRLIRWADRVGDEQCIFLPYSKTGEPIEEQWLRLLGVDESFWPGFAFDTKRINRSYVPQALELKRLLNYVLSGEDGLLAKRIDWALQAFSDLSEESGEALGGHLDPQELARLVKLSARRNAQLAQRFPSLASIVDQSENYLHQSGSEKAGRPLDLRPALAHLAQSCPDDIEALSSRVQVLDREAELHQKSKDDVMRLAELLRVYTERELQ